MLIIEVAFGIVLAVIILRYYPMLIVLCFLALPLVGALIGVGFFISYLLQLDIWPAIGIVLGVVAIVGIFHEIGKK